MTAGLVNGLEGPTHAKTRRETPRHTMREQRSPGIRKAEMVKGRVVCKRTKT